jgi:hypothetical protein
MEAEINDEFNHELHHHCKSDWEGTRGKYSA